MVGLFPHFILSILLPLRMTLGSTTMQHFTIKTLLLQLLLLLGATYTMAQVRAITSNGDEVMLYPNGTWEYISRQPNPDDYREPSATVGAGISGRHIGVIVRKQLLFVLRDGVLEDVIVYDTKGQPAYSYREGVYQLPYGWQVRYEPLSDRVAQFGPYTFKYQMLSDRLERVGTCEIDYEMFSDRIRRIGGHEIRYNSFSNLIRGVGKIEILYDAFNERVTGLRGQDSNLEIYFMRDGKNRPLPLL